jgi:hypothetical protein
MKTLLTSLVLLLGISFSIQAQDKTTIEAANTDISDNLDLEAVASLFADAEDLEEFEQKLNDPESRYSNLDLNEDGYVDYLRVLEKKKGNAHSITIQAVIGKDQYQDVAFIDVERDNAGKTRVQIVGDVYMYGPDYIIEPVYVRPPVIYTWFWGPSWTVWYSPWYWGYYPPRWRVWNPYPYYAYRAHIRPFVHVHHTYHYVHYRNSVVCKDLSSSVARKDLAKSNPDMAFNARQKDKAVKNKYELDNKRGTQTLAKPVPAKDVKTTGREIKSDWKTEAQREGRATTVKDNKAVVPSRSTKIETQDTRTDQAKPRTTEEKPQTKPSDSQPVKETKPSREVKESPTRPAQQSTKPTRSEQKKATPRQETKPRSSTRPSSSSSRSKTSTKAPSNTRSSSTKSRTTRSTTKSTPSRSTSTKSTSSKSSRTKSTSKSSSSRGQR